MGLASELKIPMCRMGDHLRNLMENPPHVNTLRNWAVCGVRNPRGKLCFLETTLIGRSRFTSMEAFHRFCEETNQEPED
jgi:hypothetical protein